MPGIWVQAWWLGRRLAYLANPRCMSRLAWVCRPWEFQRHCWRASWCCWVHSWRVCGRGAHCQSRFLSSCWEHGIACRFWSLGRALGVLLSCTCSWTFRCRWKWSIRASHLGSATAVCLESSWLPTFWLLRRIHSALLCAVLSLRLSLQESHPLSPSF